MAVIRSLTGRVVRLRTAEESDAIFTIQIRNDPELTHFIPRIETTEEQQRAWIRRQREMEEGCFLVYETLKGDRKGTLSFYDVDRKQNICELGRYISYGNALENVEAAVLLLDYLFEEDTFQTIILNNDERHAHINQFWKHFGAKFYETVPMQGWTASQYRLQRDDYLKMRTRVKKMLEGVTGT